MISFPSSRCEKEISRFHSTPAISTHDLHDKLADTPAFQIVFNLQLNHNPNNSTHSNRALSHQTQQRTPPPSNLRNIARVVAR